MSVSEGVREKLRRAQMHREDFERRVERFVNSNAYTVSRHDNAKTGNRVWRVHENRTPPLVRWGALIGECLFNFRSALDHLAYDLAVAYSGFPLRPEVEEGSEFPIFADRSPSAAELRRKIGAIHPKARDLIAGMQPYGRKDRAALKYLYLLHNFDKHRTLHLVSGVSTALAHYGQIDYINFRPFKDGDILALAPIDSSSEAQGDPSIMFGVAFAESGPGRGAPDAAWTLRWIEQHITTRVSPPLLPFL